jgi:hypothetical protein
MKLCKNSYSLSLNLNKTLAKVLNVFKFILEKESDVYGNTEFSKLIECILLSQLESLHLILMSYSYIHTYVLITLIGKDKLQLKTHIFITPAKFFPR